MPEFIEVDPSNLHLPPSRSTGADPGKLARQIAKHGDSLDGMPPIQVIRGKDGNMRINDGVTRYASREAAARRGCSGRSHSIPAPIGCDADAESARFGTMKNQLRADLLVAVTQLCERYPHWRFGQLIANVAGWADKEVWDVEDEQLLEAARQHLEQLEPSPR